jgi:hypothetical protein
LEMCLTLKRGSVKKPKTNRSKEKRLLCSRQAVVTQVWMLFPEMHGSEVFPLCFAFWGTHFSLTLKNHPWTCCIRCMKHFTVQFSKSRCSDSQENNSWDRVKTFILLRTPLTGKLKV